MVNDDGPTGPSATARVIPVPPANPWWSYFFKEIIAGVIGLFFALLLWQLKENEVGVIKIIHFDLFNYF